MTTGVDRPCKEGTGSVLRPNPVELRKGPRIVLNWLQTSGRVELVHVGMRQTSQARCIIITVNLYSAFFCKRSPNALRVLA